MSVRREKPQPLTEKGERSFEDRRRTLQCVEDREASTPFAGSGSGFAAEDS